MGYFGNTWAEDRCTVETLEKDGTQLKITLGEPSYYGVKNEGSGFWLFNALCEVDSPGEYFCAVGNLYLSISGGTHYYMRNTDVATASGNTGNQNTSVA